MKKETEEKQWRAKFGEEKTDDNSFEAWKREQRLWDQEERQSESEKANKGCENAFLDYKLGKGLLREAYNRVLSDFAKEGKHFNDWVHDRSEHNEWKRAVFAQQIDLLRKIIANPEKLKKKLEALCKSTEIDGILNERLKELELERFKTYYSEFNSEDYQKYLKWKTEIDEERKNQEQELFDKGIKADSKEFFCKVTLYYNKLYEALNKFAESNSQASFDDWLNGGFDEFKQKDWWVGALRGLSGYINRKAFDDLKDDEAKLDVRKALQFLQEKSKAREAEGRAILERESEIKNDKKAAYKAQKALENEKARIEKQRLQAEKEEAKAAERKARILDSKRGERKSCAARREEASRLAKIKMEERNMK